MSIVPPSLVRAARLAPLLLIIGCDAPGGNSPSSGGEVGRPAATADAGRGAEGERGVVLFVGTSLTAAYQLDPEQGFPARVQEKIDDAGLPFRVVNAGVSGETAAGARRRMQWLLRQPFDVLVLETGANDMLRGAEPDSVRVAIEEIVGRVRAERPGTPIVLAGMRALPNLGRDYVRRFEAVYPETAARDDLVLIPFLLDGVAGNRSLNLPDGIHPNPQGHRRVAETVWETLEPVLREEARERREAA